MEWYTLVSVICLLAVTNGSIFDSEVCFGELGCFSNEGEFVSLERPINLLPNKPEEIGTQFFLYTRSNPLTGDELETHNDSLLHLSNFTATNPTKFIIHGYKSFGKDKPWVLNMTRELLKHGDYNVIVVDWINGSDVTYARAASNCRVVGAQIALLINYLNNQTASTPQTMHLIGHSLGAQIAGYAGERLTNLARISGLDPSAPYFEHTGPKVRLDPTDAEFVDVIHTDIGYILGLGLGINGQSGHVDFYPNGGRYQPGCTEYKIPGAIVGGIIGLLNKLKPGAKAAFMCSHKRSEALFTESINSVCPFNSYSCSDVHDIKSGKCFHKHGQLGRLGFHADKVLGRGKHMLQTFDAQPYCAYHYQMIIVGKSTINGRIFVTLTGTNGTSERLEMTDHNTFVSPDEKLHHFLISRTDVGHLQYVDLEYDETDNLIGVIFSDDWKLETLQIFQGESEENSMFCVSGTTITSKKSKRYHVSPKCP
ncbi:pancreatic triacylglycerol lipase-like [Octopus sinensis]|uniref:Pancreatic triacylglycerol lipase-like n=1 Tax=Octopus sinensis TaxID=2607531 RepID=A0A6P7SYQ3_9MOLL|nr:pancreatic triacylglycerol lipase-like [Octopus sinensis]